MTAPDPTQPVNVVDTAIEFDAVENAATSLTARVATLEKEVAALGHPVVATLEVQAKPAKLSRLVAKVKTELATCRKALVGPVAVLAAVAAEGKVPSAVEGVVSVVLAAASYLGIRQTKNKA